MPVWRDEPRVVPAVMYYVIHMFRMSAFLLMAGFFARMLIERRGVGGFVKDRAKRVAVPLFPFGPVIIVSISVGAVLGALPHGMQFLQSLMQQAQTPAPEAAIGDNGVYLAHLWFLYYLLIFYAIALAVRALVRAADKGGALRTGCDRWIRAVVPWAPIVIGAPIGAYLWQADAWTEWLGLPAPASFTPNPMALVGYGVPFALGWLLHRQVHVLLGVQKLWIVYAIAAAALTVLCLSLIGATPRWTGPTLFGVERAVYSFAYAMGLWCWVFAAVGAAERFLSAPHTLTRYLADASYWVYLMHMAALLFFIVLLRPYDWHWTIKMTIMIGGSMPILLVSYHYLVRFTWIGAVLNGRRHPRPERSPPPDAAPARS